jgi:hypothetical protein
MFGQDLLFGIGRAVGCALDFVSVLMRGKFGE